MDKNPNIIVIQFLNHNGYKNNTLQWFKDELNAVDA